MFGRFLFRFIAAPLLILLKWTPSKVFVFLDFMFVKTFFLNFYIYVNSHTPLFYGLYVDSKTNSYAKTLERFFIFIDVENLSLEISEECS